MFVGGPISTVVNSNVREVASNHFPSFFSVHNYSRSFKVKDSINFEPTAMQANLLRVVVSVKCARVRSMHSTDRMQLMSEKGRNAEPHFLSAEAIQARILLQSQTDIDCCYLLQ